MSAPIWYSLYDNDLATFKSLWTANAGNSIRNSFGQGILHHAAATDKYEFAEHMLKNGANPNIRSGNSSSTPLVMSVRRTRPIFFLIVRYGGNPYIKNRDGHDATEMHPLGSMSYLVVELVCGEADSLSLDLWRVIKPFIYKV